jgi:AcrR family transcriptional regulator
MAHVGRPRKAERAAIDPDEILARAAELFAARGYRATSLVHVANELGITRQALYHYFPSKQAILIALVGELFELLEAELAAVDACDADAPPAERLRRLLEGHGRVVATHLALVALLVGEQAELNAAGVETQQLRHAAYRDRFAAAYRDGMQAGELRTVDPWTASLTLVAAVDALTVWYHPEGGMTPGEAAALAADLAMSGVLRDG